MAAKIFDNSPIEPAHPMAIKLRDDLLKLYGHIREKFQGNIDEAFDNIARQIGYVVTSTLPVSIELGEKGVVKKIELGADHLRETVFEKGMAKVFDMIKDDPFPFPKPCKFNIYLIWFDALKLKFRTEWMEPAHYFRKYPAKNWAETAGFTKPSSIMEKFSWKMPVMEERQKIEPDIPEPAHWFDPNLRIDIEEKIVITAIDEIYPELRLVDRIIYARENIIREIGPGVREPAHFRKTGGEMFPESAINVLSELASVLKKYGF